MFNWYPNNSLTSYSVFAYLVLGHQFLVKFIFLYYIGFRVFKFIQTSVKNLKLTDIKKYIFIQIYIYMQNTTLNKLMVLWNLFLNHSAIFLKMYDITKIPQP